MPERQPIREDLYLTIIREIDTPGSHLNMKFDAPGNHLNMKLDAPGKSLNVKLDAPGKSLNMKFDALRERELIAPVDCVGLAAHVGFPAVGA
jgi:hypothetical protein